MPRIPCLTSTLLLLPLLFGFTDCSGTNEVADDTGAYIFQDTCKNWAGALCVQAVTECGTSPMWQSGCRADFTVSCLEAVGASEDPDAALDILKTECRASQVWAAAEVDCEDFVQDDHGGWTALTFCPNL